MSYKSKTKFVWQEKPKPKPSQLFMTGIEDTDRQILLHLDIISLNKLVINKPLLHIFTSENFWCDWLALHYSSVAVKDCEFLAKISHNKKKFNLVMSTIKWCLTKDVQTLINYSDLDDVIKKLMTTDFFWSMWWEDLVQGMKFDIIFQLAYAHVYNIKPLLNLVRQHNKYKDIINAYDTISHAVNWIKNNLTHHHIIQFDLDITIKDEGESDILFYNTLDNYVNMYNNVLFTSLQIQFDFLNIITILPIVTYKFSGNNKVWSDDFYVTDQSFLVKLYILYYYYHEKMTIV